MTLSLNLTPGLIPETTVSTPSIQEVSIATNLTFDTSRPLPLSIATPQPQIEVGQSREQEAKAAKARAKVNQPQRVNKSIGEDPGLELKRALVQQIAADEGIDWRLLEAVWQIESGKAWKTAVTSSAGAMGPMQFMPGTWRHYGGNSDATSAPDALRAGAKLLAANGAAAGDIHRALFAYNHAEWYVTKVKNIMNSI